ncbi:GNAT family N-acetyltransferase [Haloarcula sp. S1AR25-5A]|uniref:GNAT family N-acetyltransferase n=1 Tax=Haloarcula terrestris TaxID=2950533 RepID=A0AAE4JFT2_9EURY|nr:GNAT family N-acetyltransferase [Haloarcula terrestris]MDS0220698.1 GNAT family N-acetyltransferase [Haloarcula terrestris]
MELREAKPPDRPAIRDVARRSLEASYSLGPKAITSAIEEWYDEERITEALDEEDRLILVADQDGQVVGLSESVLSSDSIGTILWLHVDPAYRGEGIGSALFDETHRMLHERGAETLQGRVLADNVEGNSFYEDRGFERAGTGEVDIAGRTYVENLYTDAAELGREPVADDGQTVYVDHNNHESGSMAPFHVVHVTEDGSDRYGYYCSNCETLANAMDSMGRIECDNCGNVRKPMRWDAAYL